MAPPHLDHVHITYHDWQYKYKILAWNGNKLFYMYVAEHETMDDVYARERFVNPAYSQKGTIAEHARFPLRLLFGCIGEKIKSLIVGRKD